MTHHYRLFGLSFASQQPIAGLEPATMAPVACPDVRIRFAEVAEPDETVDFLGMRVKATAAGLYIHAPNIGRFQVVGGDEIVVSPEGQDAALARDHLLGTAMAALLQQRDYLPLHANVMAWNGRAYAFAGASGAGKSTLAAHLQARGYGFMSDDLCAVSWDDEGRPRAWPGIPRVKLWRDALAELALDPEKLRPLSWTTEKFEVPAPYQMAGGSLPLAAVYDLREEEDGAPRGVHAISGVDAVNTLVAHTYRRRLIDLQGGSETYLRRVVGLAQSLPVFALRRRWGFDALEEELCSIHRSVTATDATLCSATKTTGSPD